MDKIKLKHVAIFVASVVVVTIPTIYLYNVVTTHINTAATTAPATTTA